MKILVGCEASGTIRDALRAVGHDAWSCDLRRSNSQYHIHGDVRNHLNEGWDGAIFHPPCTRLTKAIAQQWFLE